MMNWKMMCELGTLCSSYVHTKQCPKRRAGRCQLVRPTASPLLPPSHRCPWTTSPAPAPSMPPCHRKPLSLPLRPLHKRGVGKEGARTHHDGSQDQAGCFNKSTGSTVWNEGMCSRWEAPGACDAWPPGKGSAIEGQEQVLLKVQGAPKFSSLCCVTSYLDLRAVLRGRELGRERRKAWLLEVIESQWHAS